MRTIALSTCYRTRFCTAPSLTVGLLPRSRFALNAGEDARVPSSPPITPIPIRERPPIRSDRLAIGWIVWFGEVHLFWVVLKAFDLIPRVSQKRSLVFVVRLRF